MYGVFNGNFQDAVYSALEDMWMISKRNHSMFFIRNNDNSCLSRKYKDKSDTQIRGGKVFPLCSPDGRLFIALMPQSMEYIVHIWNAVTGRFITAIECPKNIACAANVKNMFITHDSTESFYETDICYGYYETGWTFHKWNYYRQPLCCNEDIHFIDDLIHSLTFVELFVFWHILCESHNNKIIQLYDKEPSYKIFSLMLKKSI